MTFLNIDTNITLNFAIKSYLFGILALLFYFVKFCHYFNFLLTFLYKIDAFSYQKFL